MTTAQPTELCRITVFGPGGRADLAVPISTTVAGLLPVLLRHTESEVDGSWVLQRLGEAPFDPDGTPETLNWLEGEQLYLRPVEDPMPELDFDDIADGMATVVSRQGDRWRPEFSRRLFLGLSAVVVLTMVLTLFDPGSTIGPMVSALSLTVVFLGASLATARFLQDGMIASMAGLSSCVFAYLAGAIGVSGVPGALAFEPLGALIGGLCAAGAAGALLALRPVVAEPLPIQPFGTVALAGVTLAVGLWLNLGFGYSPVRAAGLIATAFFCVVVFAPKMATRSARLRGPQLPRTADELQIDIEPAPADEVTERTVTANRYLDIFMVGASMVFVVTFLVLLRLDNWLGWTLTALFAFSLLLRARDFNGAWQRVSSALAGTAGVMFTLLSLLTALPSSLRGPILILLCGTIVLLVLAALRPATRRMLPLWGYLANIAETCIAIALIPLLLQLLGVFAWARGLAG